MKENIPRRKVAVVAVGGNSLITDAKHQTVPDQIRAARKTCVHIAGMIDDVPAVMTGNHPSVSYRTRREHRADARGVGRLLRRHRAGSLGRSR